MRTVKLVREEVQVSTVYARGYCFHGFSMIVRPSSFDRVTEHEIEGRVEINHFNKL